MIETLIGVLKNEYHLEGRVGGWIYRADGAPLAHGWVEFAELMQKRRVIVAGKRIDFTMADKYLKARDHHLTQPSVTHPHGEYAGPPPDTMVTVKIGKFERTYILVRTNAPLKYDGFGTLELYTTEGAKGVDLERTVLVDVEHREWQEGRYRSGLHSYELVDEDLSAWVTERLYKRLTGDLKVEPTTKEGE